MSELIQEAKRLIHIGQTKEAIALLEQIGSKETQDAVCYLKGNAYRREGNLQQAMEAYLEAMEINPDSPATQAYQMARNIMEFRNKEMFNH